MKATITGQRYDALELINPTLQEYDEKYLLTLSGKMRYNFWEVLHFGSFFMQTGYSFGKFTENEKAVVNRWEIIAIGAQSQYFQKLGSHNIGMEVGGGIEKGNLHKKLTFSTFVGVNYYFQRSEN